MTGDKDSQSDASKAVVATVDKHRAIDHTPLYYIMVTQRIEPGSVLVFDAAENVIRLESTGGKT